MDKYNHIFGTLAGKILGGEPCAITFGQTSYFSCEETRVPAAWHRHENTHKKQWLADGKLMFSLKYCWFSIRYGYTKNPYEIEARTAELQS